jgi:hypothetical protein
MRLPAVAIAAAFASGIVLGLHPTVARNASSHIIVSSLFLLVASFVLAGIPFVSFGHLFVATIASLLGWVLLGFLGVCIAEQPRDANHVISLVEQNRISLKTPLRWRGHLRDEPTRLPWGYGYEIELTGVEFEGAFHPARGGLRLSFTAVYSSLARSRSRSIPLETGGRKANWNWRSLMWGRVIRFLSSLQVENSID